MFLCFPCLLWHGFKNRQLHGSFSDLRYRYIPIYWYYKKFTSVSAGSTTYRFVSLFLPANALHDCYGRFKCSGAKKNFKKIHDHCTRFALRVIRYSYYRYTVHYRYLKLYIMVFTYPYGSSISTQPVRIS